MLARRRRRRTNIGPQLGRCVVFAGLPYCTFATQALNSHLSQPLTIASRECGNTFITRIDRDEERSSHLRIK